MVDSLGSAPPPAPDPARDQNVAAPPPTAEVADANFAALLAAFESPAVSSGPAVGDRLSGRVINITDDSVLLDIGGKSEGAVPIAQARNAEGNLDLRVGDEIAVVVEHRGEDGALRLSRLSPDRPRNLEDLRVAFENGLVIFAKVTGMVKGGFSVNAGERAFLPQSRSGIRDAGEMYKLVGREIRCRISREPRPKSVVLDRRSVLEEEERAARESLLSRLREGDTISGVVRSLATYGAFVDIGGVDALLHVSDMSWSHLADAGKMVSLGDQLQVRVLKIDRAKQRVAVGLKQLTPDPWNGVVERFPVGRRVRGVVLRTPEFGAFVELEPGLEGLIHVTEMSWSRRQLKSDQIVKTGDVVEAVVLAVAPEQRRISLGLKQALGDPWADAATRYAPGAIVEGRVRNLQPFGAFVEIAEGVDGMIHIGDLSDKRLKHPEEVLKLDEMVRAVVLELDAEKRRLRLGLKQLAPTPLDEFIGAHALGQVVSGRVLRAYPGRIELAAGVEAACPSASPPVRRIEEGTLGAKLAAVWKPALVPVEAPAPGGVELKAGQVRRFRLTVLDQQGKSVEVEPA